MQPELAELRSHSLGLETLLRPLSIDVFLKEYWEKQPYAASYGDTAFCSDLCSVADVDAVIQLTCLKADHDDLRLVRTIGEESTSQPIPRMPSGSLDIYRIYQAYHEGYTVIVNRMHTRWRSISALCRRLEGELRHPVGANLYYSRANAQGFAPHFDTHDVLVLQLAGSKNWQIYDTVGLPLSDEHRTLSRTDLGQAKIDVVLAAGDCLYIPRGFIHEAHSSNGSSLHLTIGIEPFRWIDIINEIVRMAAHDDERLRMAIPFHLLSTDDAQGEVANQLQSLLHSSWSSYSAAAIRRLIDKSILTSGVAPVPDGHFCALDQIGEILINTHMARRSGMWCEIFHEADSVGIRFPGNSVTGPPTVKEALRFIATNRTFVVSELPGLSDESKLVLVRRLVREGLLTLSH